jgi:hypothetical protein
MHYTENYLLTLSSTLQASIDRVKQLHSKMFWTTSVTCVECAVEYPCPTIKALNGTQ